jgi:TPR repeat protein
MSDDRDRESENLIPFVRGDLISRSASLVRRGLSLLEGGDDTTRRAGAQHGCELVSRSASPVSTGETVPEAQEEVEEPWVAELREGAVAGDAAAQLGLGDMYNCNWAGPNDYAEAARWYRAAAEQGNAVAQYNLGYAYDKGRGVPQDDTEAVRWYRAAAEQGHGDAQFLLAYAESRLRSEPTPGCSGT